MREPYEKWLARYELEQVGLTSPATHPELYVRYHYVVDGIVCWGVRLRHGPDTPEADES